MDSLVTFRHLTQAKYFLHFVLLCAKLQSLSSLDGIPGMVREQEIKKGKQGPPW